MENIRLRNNRETFSAVKVMFFLKQSCAVCLGCNSSVFAGMDFRQVCAAACVSTQTETMTGEGWGACLKAGKSRTWIQKKGW